MITYKNSNLLIMDDKEKPEYLNSFRKELIRLFKNHPKFKFKQIWKLSHFKGPFLMIKMANFHDNDGKIECGFQWIGPAGGQDIWE
jgi:hypothetical protein